MVGTGGVENGQIEVAQPNPVGQSAPLNTLVEGCRLPVNRNKDDAQGDWTPAEILSIRKNSSGENQYYVHYVDFNKRLDEWVTQHRLDHRLDLSDGSLHRGQSMGTILSVFYRPHL